MSAGFLAKQSSEVLEQLAQFISYQTSLQRDRALKLYHRLSVFFIFTLAARPSVLTVN